MYWPSYALYQYRETGVYRFTPAAESPTGVQRAEAGRTSFGPSAVSRARTSHSSRVSVPHDLTTCHASLRAAPRFVRRPPQRRRRLDQDRVHIPGTGPAQMGRAAAPSVLHPFTSRPEKSVATCPAGGSRSSMTVASAADSEPQEIRVGVIRAGTGLRDDHRERHHEAHVHLRSPSSPKAMSPISVGIRNRLLSGPARSFATGAAAMTKNGPATAPATKSLRRLGR